MSTLWIGPPLIIQPNKYDINHFKNRLQQIEKQQEEELAAIRDFKPKVDVTYGFDEDIDHEGDGMNIIIDEGDASDEDDTSTQQADDDDLGFLDVDDSEEFEDSGTH